MLLDTCALLWLAQGGGRLTAETRELIKEEPIVSVSAISGFEIGIKSRNNKLSLPVKPADWFKAVLDHHDLLVLPLDLAVCTRSTELPSIHNDQCDRLIIASAEIHRLTVVTSDPIFKQYGIGTRL